MRKQTKRFLASMLALLLTVSCVTTDLGGNVLTVSAAEEVALTTVSENDITSVSENETVVDESGKEAEVTETGKETEGAVSSTTVSENENVITVSENDTNAETSEKENDTTASSATVSENEADATVSGKENTVADDLTAKPTKTVEGTVNLSSGLTTDVNYGVKDAIEIYALTDMTYKSESVEVIDEGTVTGYVVGSVNPDPKNGNVPNKGAVIKFVAKQDATVSFVINANSGKKYYWVTEAADGSSSYDQPTEDAANDGKYIRLTYDLKAGNTYYAYRSGSKASWADIDYTYEQEIAYELIEKSVNLSSGLTTDVNYGAKDAIEIYALTDMTYKSESVEVIDEGTVPGYVVGSVNPDPKNGNVPNKGAVIKFVAKQDATVSFVINANSGKKYYWVTESADGSSSYDQPTEDAANDGKYIRLTYELKAGNTYYAYRSGSKASWAEITYKYMGEVSDELPEIELKDGVKAFDTAQGGGMYATGGRGGDVYVVTSLADDNSEGTLRYGINTAPAEGRIIVFNVGGTINLKQSLKLNSNITIAGQTAPGEGITIAGYDTNISDTENVIIRFVHFRPGTAGLKDGGDSIDALWGRDNDTFIIDHCSFSWNTDECLSTYRGQNGTVQYCIISESLTVSGHSKGRHGYGGIFGGDNTVFQYNLIADHTSRNPRVGGGYMNYDDTDHAATLQISNNVTYNYGYFACYGGGNAYTNYVNNYVKAGPGTRDTLNNQLIDYGETGDHVGGVYVAGNVLEEDGVAKTDGYKVTITGAANGIENATAAYEKDAFETVTLVSAEEAYDKVLAQAGVTYPKRDAIDARVIQQVEDGTGYYINTQDDVGGYCAPEVTRDASFDTDLDGIPNAWETAHGLDPNDYKDSRNLNEEGYAWVEVYFNELVEEVTSADYEAKNPEVTIDLDNNTMVAEGTGVTVKATATATNGGTISKVVFFNGAKAVFTDTEAPFEYSYLDLADGTYDISVRAYDNEDNATQSETSKLHVNSTAGTGDAWTVTDIGTPGLKSTASYVDGVMTVKGAGKIGKSEGATKGVLNDATNDNFAYVYQEMNGDTEIITRLDSYVIVDAHTFNGLMFRESLDADAAAVGVGLSMVKIENHTTWSAFMVNRAKKTGNMSVISETIDSASAAANAGIPMVQDLNFKDVESGTFNGTYLKLMRKGDTFSGYVSEDGVSWQTIGSITVDLPEKAYVGFAVDANKVGNNLENYATAKFSNIEINRAWATLTYETSNVNVDGAEVIAVGKDMTVQFSRTYGYLIPEDVEVTNEKGEAVAYTYNAETGILTLTNIQENLIIKADGIKRIVTSVDYEEVDPNNYLTVTEKEDGTIVLEQTATEGSVAASTTTPAVNQSFILFPETKDSQTLSMKIKVTDMTMIGNGKNNGVFIGHFSKENNGFTSLGFRAVESSNLTGFWFKSATKVGDGSSEIKGTKYTFEKDVVYDVTFYTNDDGWFRVTFKDENGKVDDAKLFKAHENFLQPGDPVCYGIGILGATVEITDMTLIDYEGNEIYPGVGLPTEEDKKEMEDAIASGEKTEVGAFVDVATKAVIAEDGSIKEDATAEDVVNAVIGITGTYKDEELLENEEIVEALDKLEEKMAEELESVEQTVDSSASEILSGTEADAKYAALNATADTKAIKLVVEKEENEKDLENLESSFTKDVQLNIKLVSVDKADNETEISKLKVPVTVGISAPKGFNWLRTKLLHYADGSDIPAEVEFTFKDGMIFFTVAHFSTFVFVQEAEAPSGSTGSSSSSSSDSGSSSGSSSTTYPEITTDWNKVSADVTAKVNEAATSKKETVVDVTTGANTQLPTQTLQTLRGKNTTLAMHAGNGVTFSVSGQNITAQAANSNLNLALRQNSTIPNGLVAQKLNGTVAHKAISLANEGNFGMVVNLHLALGAANQGSYANLYRYNAQKNTLEYQGSFRIVNSGQALFGLTRGGSYLVTVTKAKTAETVVAGDYTVVRGDTMYAIAARYGISLSKLIAANPQIIDPNKIYVGQKLNIR